ncbi:3-oxoacyl-ACP synthase [Flagellimonas aquimarina]|uniref:3-oxoacyl-ACP synthase n=1 Tax=Flagellimonas aquimarina TaxID=2201895 RepID=A0A316L1K5_9FLAO|nr:GreA/GreB family elongation factor [Allomuricauda koreensis]PWL39964.1 3-oxoacyl-ACP synthase [Allomuricauda koreensis]
MKEQLLMFCWQHINDRTERLHQRRVSLQESLNSETKSSAGDKHETGRAMVQLEQEKLGKQLFELEEIKRILQKVDIDKKSKKISLGSFVKTTAANYFIAISAGAVTIKDTPVFCISASSPIAKLLLGKEEGDTFVFNGKENTILEKR